MNILIGLLAYALDAPGWFWVCYWIIMIAKFILIFCD